MPIIDPKLQRSLLKIAGEDVRSSFGLFLKYLKIASPNINQSVKTVKAHILFRNDFIKNIRTINMIFNCKISLNGRYIISNYYQFLYDYLIKKNCKRKEPKCIGKYILFSQKLHLFYYMIPGFHLLGYWFFTDSSLAIFVFSNLDKLKNKSSNEIKQHLGMLNLEIDLMLAAGLTLALVAQFDPESTQIAKEFIQYTLKNHPFSEIHFNLQFTTLTEEKEKYEEVLETLRQNCDSIKGYFYLYMPFLSDISTCSKILQYLKIRPFFQVIGFSKSFDDVFKNLYSNRINPIPYYSNGFTYDKIRISLSNVALYDTDNEQSDFTPSTFSDLGFGYIKCDDFLNIHKGRVKINFENNTIKYCCFDDLHKIKPDLYVENTLYLMKADLNELDKVEKIKHKAHLYYIDEFKRKKIIAFNDEKKIQKLLSYITRAFFMMTRFTKFIELRSNQIFAALEACSMFSNDTSNKSKGFIYQVHTGEGKSYIIQTIAAAQALMGKTVHIATSNIFLANRDYHDSYRFFNKLGIKSAVLLHKSELPKFSILENGNENDSDDDEYDDDEDENFIYKKERFPDTFFGDELFENASGMNIDICGAEFNNKKNVANVIYSTFINFESLYLRLMEMRPVFFDKYFSNCILLIDEADSILIDELTNGTILSRPMNTNGKEILIYVYQCKMKNLPTNDVLNGIKTIWPKCTDINEDDIKAMYKEIDLVNTMEFTNGKKYCVESMDIDRSKNENVVKKVINKINKVKEKVKKIKEDAINIPIKAIKESIKQSFYKSKRKKKHIHHTKTQPNFDSNNNNNSLEKTKSEPNLDFHFHYGLNEEEKKLKQIKVNYIVPFDYDHKGILEPNKEFNGFVQQFIAIKEMFSKPDQYKHMFIKDVSMSYLFVSHPIFVRSYSGVCGFTGTIGGSYEKSIFSKYYMFDTLKIPRNNPNRRVDMPIVLCKNIKERNKRIIEEIIQFNKRENPVLVIFQDINEILIVYQMLKKRGINHINVFDGRDQSIKPDFVAGRKGAISLGTNVCGRGTDIKKPVKPLHVIISYYTSNVRVMQQAFGRTGRKGTQGTVHIICPKNQYLRPLETVKNDNLNAVLGDFKFKNDLQMKFINEFKKNRRWIFDPISKSQRLDYKTIGQLREAKINVNRIIAYNYKFPLCLNIDTFLMIQAQKIFSLFNCPNCVYTWILFQRYIREMIFESWSLFIDQIERRFSNEDHSIKSKNEHMEKQYVLLFEKLSCYIPNKSDFDIVETFMFIYNKVVKDWQDKIYKYIPKDISCIPLKQEMTDRFLSFNVGFKPYNLINGSGARISESSDEYKEPAFIIDPEMSYVRKEQKKDNFIKVSITEAIDKIFNKICLILNNLIGAYIGVKFFLRRTLGGCEFGMCIDLDLKNVEKDFIEKNCLIDRDPLLVFTISVRSLAPLLAGVLIFGLVYLVSISGTIAQYITAFPEKLGIELVKKTMKYVFEQLIISNLKKQIEFFCDKIIEFLQKKLEEQIENIDLFDNRLSITLKVLSQIISVNEFSKTGDKINELFNNNVQFTMKSQVMQGFISKGLPFAHLIKIGIMLILCLAAFLINFNNQKKAIAQSKEEKNAAAFDKDYSNDKKLEGLIKKNKDTYNEKDHISIE